MLAAGSVLEPLYQTLGGLLAWFYGLVPSYGVAIALLTVAVRLLMFPLTTKQAKSMREMQRVQPEIKRLQAKHKNDRQKLNEEMMKFYKEHRINPLAGCLPVLLQAPLFIVLYRIIHDLSPGPAKGKVSQCGEFICPKHIPKSSEMYEALVDAGGRMVSWGIDLSQKASSANSIAEAFPFYVLVALVVATGYYQQRQMTARSQSAPNPQMQAIGKIFPVFFGLISLSIPAGVVVYFIVSNVWQIGQQAWIFRSQDPAPLTPPDTSKPGAKSKEAGKGQPDSKALDSSDGSGRSSGKNSSGKNSSGRNSSGKNSSGRNSSGKRGAKPGANSSGKGGEKAAPKPSPAVRPVPPKAKRKPKRGR